MTKDSAQQDESPAQLIDARIKRKPSQRLPHEVPNPDVTVLIANFERNASTVGRKSQLVIDSRRHLDGFFSPLSGLPEPAIVGQRRQHRREHRQVRRSSRERNLPRRTSRW